MTATCGEYVGNVHFWYG